MERKNAVCADGPIVEGEKKGGAAGGMLILCSDTEETGEVVGGGEAGWEEVWSSLLGRFIVLLDILVKMARPRKTSQEPSSYRWYFRSWD